MRVRNVPLDEIFDVLDIDGSFEVSRTASSGSTRRRCIFFGWIDHNIIKPIKEEAIEPIGDAIVNTAEGIIDFLEDGTFESERKFSFVDVDVSIMSHLQQMTMSAADDSGGAGPGD